MRIRIVGLCSGAVVCRRRDAAPSTSRGCGFGGGARRGASARTRTHQGTRGRRPRPHAARARAGTTGTGDGVGTGATVAAAAREAAGAARAAAAAARAAAAAARAAAAAGRTPDARSPVRAIAESRGARPCATDQQLVGIGQGGCVLPSGKEACAICGAKCVGRETRAGIWSGGVAETAAEAAHTSRVARGRLKAGCSNGKCRGARERTKSM